MNPLDPRSFARLCPLAAALALAGCNATFAPARMTLAEPLAAAAAEPFDGLGGKKKGQFQVAGLPVRYERMGDQLSLFDAVKFDRVSVQFEHPQGQGRCDGRAVEAGIGIINAQARPLRLECRFTGASEGSLVLRERPMAAAGTQRAREGEATFGGRVIAVESVHSLQGTPLPLAEPAGYRMRMNGRDVAAVELTTGTPSLRRSADLDERGRAAVLQVALALGLLWDPASAAR